MHPFEQSFGQSFGEYQYQRSLLTNRWTIALSIAIVLIFIPLDPFTLSKDQAGLLGYIRLFLFLPCLLGLLWIAFNPIPRKMFYFTATGCYLFGGLILILIDNFSDHTSAIHAFVSTVLATAFILVGVIIPSSICIPATLLLFTAFVFDILFSGNVPYADQVALVSGLFGATLIMLSWVIIREREAKALFQQESKRMRGAELRRNWSHYFSTALRQELASKCERIQRSFETIHQLQYTSTYLDRSEYAFDQCKKLIEKLLASVSWREALALKVSKDVCCNNLLSDCYREYRFHYPDVQFKLNPGSGFAVTGDEVLLKRALSNLLDNAIRLHDPGSEIHLTTQEPRTIAIVNEGPPIPENIEEMFEAGARGGRHERGQFGLGLYLVRIICDNHGAVLTARQDSHRAVFMITFP